MSRLAFHMHTVRSTEEVWRKPHDRTTLHAKELRFTLSLLVVGPGVQSRGGSGTSSRLASHSAVSRGGEEEPRGQTTLNPTEV